MSKDGRKIWIVISFIVTSFVAFIASNLSAFDRNWKYDGDAAFIYSLMSIGVLFLLHLYLWFKKRHKNKPTK